MKDIIINKSNNPKIKYVIFSISTDSPLFLLDEINENVKLKNGQIVLFDQLLQTGDSDNRFLSLQFVNDKFDLSSIKHVDKKQIDETLYKFISDFLRNEQLLLRYSILLEEQKNFILRGGNI